MPGQREGWEARNRNTRNKAMRTRLSAPLFSVSVITLLLLAWTTAWAGDASPASRASRPPENGCSWKLLESASPKASVLAMDCEFNGQKLTHVFENGVLLEKYASNGDAVKIIELSQKERADTPQQALEKAYVKKLSEYESQHCVVRRADPKWEMEKPLRDKQKSAWEIAPDETYAAKIKRETPKDEMPEESCGDHGLPVDGRAYFEFHEKSPGMFAWIMLGQDRPLFDEQSLEF